MCSYYGLPKINDFRLMPGFRSWCGSWAFKMKRMKNLRNIVDTPWKHTAFNSLLHLSDSICSPSINPWAFPHSLLRALCLRGCVLLGGQGSSLERVGCADPVAAMCSDETGADDQRPCRLGPGLQVPVAALHISEPPSHWNILLDVVLIILKACPLKKWITSL